MALLFLFSVHAEEPGIALAPYASGFALPVFIGHAGDGSQRLSVVEKGKAFAEGRAGEDSRYGSQ